MDRRTIDDQHIIARYIAGQLTDAEASAFEAHYMAHPEVVRDIERTLRLKEGLAILKERGELDALLYRRMYWRPAMGLAAGIAALVIGVWLWVGQTTVAPIVGTVAALVDTQGKPLYVASTHLLVRTRGSASVVEIALPQERSAIELQMIPSSRTDGPGHYRVVLGRLDAANNVTPVAKARAIANAADGLVTAYLDSAQLERGRYAIELQPEGASPGTPSDRFLVEVR
jgi:hypothetical protein